jgi:uncharacterized protein YxeA
MKKLLLLLSLVISITSCDNELRDFDKAEENSLVKEGSFKVTPEEAKQELIDFISEFNASGAKTKSYFGKSIKDNF